MKPVDIAILCCLALFLVLVGAVIRLIMHPVTSGEKVFEDLLGMGLFVALLTSIMAIGFVACHYILKLGATP